MKQKKTKIIIGVLLALVLFASSIALLMYSKQSKLNKYVETHVEVYISSHPLSKGDMIGADDIKISSLPKSYIGFTPLTKEEIIGRYVSVDMLGQEPMRPEKITQTKPSSKKIQKEQVSITNVNQEIEKVDGDTIAISMNVFRNLDTSLKKGDFIDIVSVKPKSTKRDNKEYVTKYIALHVEINSFILNSKSVQKLRVQKYDKDNKPNGFDVADSIIIEMSPKNIKNFLNMYYTTLNMNANRVNMTKANNGHLWMVKCASLKNSKIQKDKNSLMVDAKIYKKKVRKSNVDKVVISYEK